MKKILLLTTLLLTAGTAQANCGYDTYGNYACNYGSQSNGRTRDGDRWRANTYGNQSNGTIDFGSGGSTGFRSNTYGNSSNFNFDNGQSVRCTNYAGIVRCY